MPSVFGQAAEAELHLAALRLELGLEPRTACIAQVIRVMPALLGSGSMSQQAELHRTLADLYLSSPDSDSLTSDAERCCCLCHEEIWDNGVESRTA